MLWWQSVWPGSSRNKKLPVWCRRRHRRRNSDIFLLMLCCRRLWQGAQSILAMDTMLCFVLADIRWPDSASAKCHYLCAVLDPWPACIHCHQWNAGMAACQSTNSERKTGPVDACHAFPGCHYSYNRLLQHSMSCRPIPPWPGMRVRKCT